MAGRPHTKRRGGRLSAYHVRSADLNRIFYASTHDEDRGLPTRANDVVAREILADALEERGMAKLAEALRRFPKSVPQGSWEARHRASFSASLLREKVRRAIFGPQPKTRTTPRKPQRYILLAEIATAQSRHHGEVRKIDYWSIDAADWGKDYIIEVSDGGYGSVTFLVRATDQEGALEAAEERWPDWFFDEVDAPEEGEEDTYEGRPHPTKEGVWIRPTEAQMLIYRAGWVSRARVIERAGNAAGTAYVPNRGIVEYQ